MNNQSSIRIPYGTGHRACEHLANICAALIATGVRFHVTTSQDSVEYIITFTGGH